MLKKKCTVCGDKATCFNYCALTCEPCKIFFYRYQTKTFRCIKEGRCEIDIATRKSCQKCRMDKCLAVGMRKTFSRLFTKTNVNRSSQTNSLRTILKDKLTKSEESKQNIQKKRSSPFELNQGEQEQIKLIQNAILDTFEDETKLKIVGEVSHIFAIETLHWPDMYARRIVRFCKNMNAFKQLNKNDQLIILREFVIELLATRLSFFYDIENDGYLIIGNEAGNEALFVKRKQSQPKKFPEEKKDIHKFFHSLQWEMENDAKIRDLLISILLFQPREKIEYQEFVNYQYSFYCRLLRKYLSFKYRNMYRATRKYETLMSLIDNFKEIKKSAKLFFQDSSVNQMPELFIEVLNLC